MMKFILIILSFSCTLEAKSFSYHGAGKIAPYLMQDNHPIKPFLDDLFSSSRVIFNLETLTAAGFIKANPRNVTQLIVTRHQTIPGYVFKLYLDTQRCCNGLAEHKIWIARIQGVEKIRNEIAACGLESIFKAPQKWIYALPKYPKPEVKCLVKYYILVEEDMDILSEDDNLNLWSSLYVTPGLLDGLYYMLKAVGLDDCTHPDNIPFSRDGRVAFIDTQSFGKDVNYKALKRFLHKSNQEYWDSICALEFYSSLP